MFVPRSQMAPLAARQDGATTANSTLAPSTSSVASSVPLTSIDSVTQTDSSSSASSSSPTDSASSSSDDGTVPISSSTFLTTESVSLETDLISTSSATSTTVETSTSSTASFTTTSDSSATTSSFSPTSTTAFSSDSASFQSVVSTSETASEAAPTETQPEPSQAPQPQNNEGSPPANQSSSSAISGVDPSDPPSDNDPPAKADNPIETDSIESDSAKPTDPDASAGGSDDTDSQGAPAPVSPIPVAAPSVDGAQPATTVATTAAASPTPSPTTGPAPGPVANPGSDPEPSQPTNTANNVESPSGSSGGLNPTGLSPSGSLATALSLPTTSGSPSPTPIAVAQNSHAAISGGAIAGIVIGVLFVISAVTFMSMVLVRRRLRAQRASLRAAWYPPSSRRTTPVPSTPIREVGRRNTVLNAYGPGQHLPPVQPVSISSSPEVVAPDPFWDPSDMLPPTVSASKRAPGTSANIRKSGYGAGLLGERPMDPFADPITATAINARLATDALSEEERSSWVDQSGLFFTPSPRARLSQSSPRSAGGFGKANFKSLNRLSDGSSAGHGDYREFVQPRVM